tara:strand:- start:1149 stop:1508 length:360 start_codon:yes stop_codon:yes gene_type:complete
VINSLLYKVNIQNTSLNVILYQLTEYINYGFSNMPLFPKLHEEYIKLKFVDQTESYFFRLFTNYGLLLGTFIITKLLFYNWYSLFIILTLGHYTYFYIPFFLFFIRAANDNNKELIKSY